MGRRNIPKYQINAKDSQIYFFSGSFRFVWEEAEQRGCKRGGKTGRITCRAEFTPRSAVARPAACRREATWASS